MHSGEAQGAHDGAHALTPAPRAASASSTAPDARDTLTAARLSTTRLLSFVAMTVQPAGKQGRCFRHHHTAGGEDAALPPAGLQSMPLHSCCAKRPRSQAGRQAALRKTWHPWTRSMPCMRRGSRSTVPCKT